MTENEATTRHMPPVWFSQWLTDLRLSQGWSYRVAGRRIGISAGHLYKMEKGTRCPSRSVAYDIGKAYGLRGDELDDLLSVAVDGAGRDYPNPV